MTGVARDIFFESNFEEQIWIFKKKNLNNFFSLCNPRGSQGFPEKKSAHSVKPFGQLAIADINKYRLYITYTIIYI